MDTKPTYSDGNEPYVDDSSATVSVLDLPVGDEQIAPQPEAQEWTGPRCEKCGAPIKSELVNVCRSCGWYASLGMHVEVDPNWETTDDCVEHVQQQPAPSHLEVWLNLLPRWAWIIIATVLAVVVESVAVRLATPAGSSLRTFWSLTQLAVGALAFVGCHAFNFLVMVAADADVGLLDVLLRPLKIWNRVLRELPARLWAVDAAAAGLTAAVMSVAVIGGIPYDRLWDWGIEPPKKQNLMGAVMSQMQRGGGEGSGNLEDAVQDFAGSQNLDQQEQPPTPPPPPKPREETECVILGYRANQEGRIHTLLLGTARGRKLVYAGTVSPPSDENALASLSAQLVSARTNYPFLHVQAEATWVEPRLTCRVSYTRQLKDGRLVGMRWEEFSGSLSLP